MTREEQLRFLRNERELFGKNTSKQKGQVLEIKPKFKNNQK